MIEMIFCGARQNGREYCPEEGSINGVVRFGKADKAYIERNSFLPRQLL